MLERGPYRYGLGFEYATLGGAEWLGHYGTTIGFRSALFHQPETEATIILLSNRQDLEIVALAEQVGTLLTSG
jgi:CubicO group peptidase (beta-lactamase class C family)